MKRPLKRFIAAAGLVVIDVTAMFLFKRFPSLFFPTYRIISKKWIALLSSLSSALPFSLWDILALVLFIIFIVSFVQMIRKRRSFLSWLSLVLLIVTIIGSEAVLGWMLNHYGPALSEEIGLTIRDYSKQELYDASEYYLLKASEYADRIKRDEEGHAMDMDVTEIGVLAGKAYQNIEDEYPIFKGSHDRVKHFSLIGDYLLYNGIIGMFMPVDGEASVPDHVPVVPLAFTMCHEAAHRLGIASEQEANFAAFMACINSDDERFLYSGFYSAFSYCFSSLYKNDPELALELYNKYTDSNIELLKQDRRDTNEIYRKYDSPLKEVSDQINDTYLKTFNEESGILSYSEVTEYLLAWYLKE